LWIRLVNLPGALTSRRHASPVDVVLDVSDPLLPANAGRWWLVGDASAAHCNPPMPHRISPSTSALWARPTSAA